MKTELIEISFLHNSSYSKGHWNIDYGWAYLNENKELIFESKCTGEVLNIEEKDLNTLDKKPFFKKYINRTKEKKSPVIRLVNKDYRFFIVPGENFVLDSKPVDKHDIIVFDTLSNKIFKNDKRFRACFTIVEQPDFTVVKRMFDKDKVFLSNIKEPEKKSWNPEEVREEELKLAEYEGLESVYEKVNGTPTIWGYTLKNLKSGELEQLPSEEVKILANQHKISNMKLVDRNGTIFLQGVGCEIANFKQVLKS